MRAARKAGETLAGPACRRRRAAPCTRRAAYPAVVAHVRARPPAAAQHGLVELSSASGAYAYIEFNITLSSKCPALSGQVKPKTVGGRLAGQEGAGRLTKDKRKLRSCPRGAGYPDLDKPALSIAKPAWL
jgi:hypothetical protein